MERLNRGVSRGPREELDVPDAMSLARPDDDRAVSAHAPIQPRRR